MVSFTSRARDSNRLCSLRWPYTRKEFLDTTLQAITHPDDRGVELDNVRRMLAGEIATYSRENRYRRKDGAFIWASHTMSLVRDAGKTKEPMYFISVIEDIDSRKRAEALAAGTAANSELAVKASNIGLWDWDLNKNNICFSREWKDQLGYTEHEIADEFFEWESRVHPDDVEPAKDRIKQFLADPHGQYEIEFRMRHKDGTWHWIYSRGEATRDENGKPTRMHGFHVDVTESKHLTKRARESAAFLREAIDALASSTAVVDQIGNIIIVNRWWREFAADSGGDNCTLFEGANYFDICDRATRDNADFAAFACSLRSVLAGGSDPQPLEYPCHSPTQERWFHASIHGFTQGADRFAVITHHDVTAVRLAARREAVEKQRETVAFIAASVAHEFNSLLFAAALQLHGLLDGTAISDAGTAKSVELINQAQSLASALLNLYAGPDTGRIEILSLYPWLPKTMERLAMILPPGIRVTTEVEFDLPEVLGHSVGLEQVLRNLLTNAATVLEERGEIRVRATLASVDDRPMVEIRVSDDGPGIPEALRSRVFDPGFTTKVRSYRSGMGLAIAAQMLEQFGGAISFEPNVPTGSTFVVQLHARPGEI